MQVLAKSFDKIHVFSAHGCQLRPELYTVDDRYVDNINYHKYVAIQNCKKEYMVNKSNLTTKSDVAKQNSH